MTRKIKHLKRAGDCQKQKGTKTNPRYQVYRSSYGITLAKQKIGIMKKPYDFYEILTTTFLPSLVPEWKEFQTSTFSRSQ